MEDKEHFWLYSLFSASYSSVIYPKVLEFFSPSLGYYPHLTYVSYLLLLDEIAYSFLNNDIQVITAPFISKMPICKFWRGVLT